jgi:hypothetical protein
VSGVALFAKVSVAAQDASRVTCAPDDVVKISDDAARLNLAELVEAVVENVNVEAADAAIVARASVPVWKISEFGTLASTSTLIRTLKN